MVNEMTALLSFMDRPIIVALVSGLILGWLAHRWQRSEQRSDLQLELLRKFPLVFETRGNLLNAWFTHVLSMAKQRTKIPAQQRQDKITLWRTEIAAFEMEFFKSEPLEDLLIPMEACFPSEDIRNKSTKMLAKWRKFDNNFNIINHKYNVNKCLSAKEIHAADELRLSSIKELENCKTALLQALAKGLYVGWWRRARERLGRLISADAATN